MILLPLFQLKYKDAGKKEMSSSLYSVLPDTAETNLAKEHSEMLSEVQNSIVMPTQQPNTVDSASSRVLHFTDQQ